MEKKNLIVCGCSFTKGHFLPETETWGGYVAKKMGLTLHNIACGGMGNEFISTETITYFLNNQELLKDSIVMIGWSETSRLTGTFENSNEFQEGFVERVTIRPQDFDSGEDGKKLHSYWPDTEERYHGYVKKNHKYLRRFFSSFAYCVYKTYYSIYVLKQFLESNNIPYIFFDAINTSKLESIERIGTHQNNYKLKWWGNHGKFEEIEELVPKWMTDTLLNKKVESLIFDNQNYISFFGQTMLGYMFTIGYDELTEGNIGHPNSIASDLFSDMIIKEYDKLYNPR